MILHRRQLGRLREIGAILVKHGWGHVAAKLGLSDLLHLRRQVAKEPTTPVRLLQAIEALGPTFVKFGQLLSTRSDLLPSDYISELSKLQDTAAPVPIEDIKSIIASELGKPVDEIYATFDESPIAAASLGQVHCATLHDGSRVIAKVQRPHIRETIESDIEILYSMARFLEKRWERARTYGLMEVVDEFAITIREELDYTREAQNTQRLKDNLAHEKRARVPEICWDLVTERVLTMEHIEGVKITDIAELASIGVDRKDISSTLASIFFRQIFIDGFFHSDPHPGNLLVTEDQRIALLDAGQVRQLDAGSRNGLISMLMAYENRDTRRFAEEVVSIGISLGDVDIPALTYDLEKVLRYYYNLPTRAINMGQILARVMDVSARHRIRLPVGFAVLGKVLANIDGINRLLNPDFNLTEAAKPYMSMAVREQLSPSELLADVYQSIIDTKSFLLALPEHLGQLLRKAIEGTLRVEFKHKGLEELESRLDKITNRLAFALIIGASLIGSSIIAVSKQTSTGILGLPLLGLIGYVVAIVLGMWLLISIIRSGRL